MSTKLGSRNEYCGSEPEAQADWSVEVADAGERIRPQLRGHEAGERWGDNGVGVDPPVDSHGFEHIEDTGNVPRHRIGSGSIDNIAVGCGMEEATIRPGVAGNRGIPRIADGEVAG